MALVNMKVAAKEQPTDLEKPEQGPEIYPYGLRITLNRQALQKLNMDPTQFKVNQRLAFFCQGEIVAIRGVDIQEITAGSEDPSITVQFTDLDVNTKRQSESEQFERFYDQHRGRPGGAETAE